MLQSPRGRVRCWEHRRQRWECLSRLSPWFASAAGESRAGQDGKGKKRKNKRFERNGGASLDCWQSRAPSPGAGGVPGSAGVLLLLFNKAPPPLFFIFLSKSDLLLLLKRQPPSYAVLSTFIKYYWDLLQTDYFSPNPELARLCIPWPQLVSGCWGGPGLPGGSWAAPGMLWGSGCPDSLPAGTTPPCTP